MKPHRSVRVGELIKRELASILSTLGQSYSEHLITVTEVRTSRDLRHANVWVSIFCDPDKRKKSVERLQNSSRRFRHLLSQRIRLKRIPEIRFELDETLDKAELIDSILKSEGYLNDRDSEFTEDEA